MGLLMKPKMYSRKENFVQEWQTRLSFQPVLTGLFVFKAILHKRNLRICCNPSLQSCDYLMITTVSCCCYTSNDIFKLPQLGTRWVLHFAWLQPLSLILLLSDEHCACLTHLEIFQVTRVWVRWISLHFPEWQFHSFNLCFWFAFIDLIFHKSSQPF
jgi:hypothetical protein